MFKSLLGRIFEKLMMGSGERSGCGRLEQLQKLANGKSRAPQDVPQRTGPDITVRVNGNSRRLPSGWRMV